MGPATGFPGGNETLAINPEALAALTEARGTRATRLVLAGDAGNRRKMNVQKAHMGCLGMEMAANAGAKIGS